ncbi:MAG TPA: SDR family NAD(P)-dependent oxidoreductase [Steroidobacteraceae bacterium]|nr:SDR family NAD(P)-dependent oxidoreductase [Steroidobacteraceae bacterium]
MEQVPDRAPERRVALVIGAGDATGSAIARRFAREGYSACLVRRNAEKLAPLVEAIRATGADAHGFAVDARRETEVAELFATVERDVGAIEVFAFNVGANVPCSVLEETPRRYFKVWEMACYAGFLTGQAAARRMVARGRGTILFTGATASLRGGASFAAFATAKHGLRALAQSMARELGPLGVHVGHVVVDGAIDTAFIRDNFPEKYAEQAVAGILQPEHVADAFWFLHMQPRDAWTFELDLRPWREKW